TRAQDDARRRAALDVLAHLGGKSELGLALDLGAPAERDAPPEPEMSEALEQALLGICQHEDGAARSLAAFFARVPSAGEPTIADVVSRTGGGEAASLLAAQLGSSGVDADAILLLELAEIGEHQSLDDDQLPLERVRGMLGHPDARLRVLACLACEKLR